MTLTNYFTQPEWPYGTMSCRSWKTSGALWFGTDKGLPGYQKAAFFSFTTRQVSLRTKSIAFLRMMVSLVEWTVSNLRVQVAQLNAVVLRRQPCSIVLPWHSRRLKQCGDERRKQPAVCKARMAALVSHHARCGRHRS